MGFDYAVVGAGRQGVALMRRLFEQQLALPDVRDVVVLRCTAQGRHRLCPRAVQPRAVVHMNNPG